METICVCEGIDDIFDGLVNRWLFNEGAEGVAASGSGSVKDTIGTIDLTPANSPTYEGSELTWKRREN